MEIVVGLFEQGETEFLPRVTQQHRDNILAGHLRHPPGKQERQKVPPGDRYERASGDEGMLERLCHFDPLETFTPEGPSGKGQTKPRVADGIREDRQADAPFHTGPRMHQPLPQIKKFGMRR